ncbi:type II secretion system F family protein [Streptomyces sp. ST2-7A]|uniref:type II secretion system F family protein n=1 Tax=Streptomyces sp. ST2-7A TaxID=2907214 RepID=UPI001F43E003|nr:type II secretion system F family protein [Streptomyces sp. ST2-7A]MCE7080082.1 type II secretion system F family protein [Streptomyces sp. ST2-7A]
MVIPVLLRAQRRRRTRAEAERRVEEVISWCAAVAAEARAGLPPYRALVAAGPAGLGPRAAEVLAAARGGDGVPEVLRRLSGEPGAEGLGAAAACWRVALDSGSSLADGLDRVADTLRAERDRRADLHAELAGPRTTALVLAGLPPVGLALGSLMGAAPVDVLLHTTPGRMCLVAGCLLEGLGLAWAAAIVRSAEHGGTTAPGRVRREGTR